MRYLIFIFILGCTSLEKDNIERQPDVVSQRANWRDYYAWDAKKKRWVWSEYLPKKKSVKKKWIEEDIKGEVTFGKPKIKSYNEPQPNGN